MARKLTAKGTKRRSELLDYAARTFARDGYHTTSVASIVEGLQVGKGVFYWYFDSKDELFIHILAEAQRELRLTQRDAIAGEHDPVRRIEQGIRGSMRWLSEHRHLFVLTEFARTEERFAPLVRAGERQAVEDALPHVAAGITAGLLRREDPEVMTAAIIGVTSHLARVLVLEQGRDPDRVAQAAISFCRDGIMRAAEGHAAVLAGRTAD